MSAVFSRIAVKRTTWPGVRLVGAVLLVALLVAAVTVPAAVWPDSYPPALAAGLAVPIAVAAVWLLAILLCWRSRERELTASELKIVHAAVRSFNNDFGHDERDVHDRVRAVLRKLPDVDELELAS